MQVPDLLFHLKQMNWTIIWYNGFQVTEYQAIKDSDPWEMGNKWSATYNCCGSLPVRVVGIQVEHSSLSEWNGCSWCLGRPSCLAFMDQSIMEERAAQISCRPSPEYWSAHEKLPKVRESFTQKHLREHSLGLTQV